MNFKLTAILAAAVLCAASASSCGKDKSSSSEVILDIKTTEASTEPTSEAEEATTTTDKKDDKKTTTTTAKSEETVTTKADDTEPVTAEPVPDNNSKPEVPDNSSNTPDPVVEAPTEAPKPKKETFSTDDIYQPMSVFTAIFGNITPQDDKGACLAKGDPEGTNYLYTYPGISFDCYSSSGTHYVYNITITGGNFSTDKGIKVGSSRAEVTAAYGEGIGMDPSYFTDNGCVTFTIDSDIVTKIQIGE